MGMFFLGLAAGLILAGLFKAAASHRKRSYNEVYRRDRALEAMRRFLK